MAEHKTPGTSHRTASLLATVVTVLLMIITAKVESASNAKAAATQATERQVIATQAITTTQQASPLTENDAKQVDQQNQLILARQLAAEAELVISDGGEQSLSLGALLAVESVRRYPSREGDRVLRSALSLMRPLEFGLTKEGYIRFGQMAFDPGGRWIAAADTYDKSVVVWDLTSGEEIASLVHDDRASNAAFSPDGHLIATTAADGTARVWKTGTWEQIARLGHDSNQVTDVTFDPTGTRLATTSQATVYIWDIVTGKEITRLEHANNVWQVAFSPYGKWIATFDVLRSIVWVWDAETGQELAQLKHNSQVETMAFSPYGKWLATASGSTAQVWEVNTGRQVMHVIHRDVVNDVAFSPDSLLLATASNDKTARLWEVGTGRERMQFAHKNKVISVDFSPDGTSLTTGSGHESGEGLARIWEVATGQEIARMEHPNQVTDVRFSPDGHKLATQDWNNQAIYVWDLLSRVPEVLRFERENDVKAVAFNADGSILASGNSDGSLQVWNTATWQEITPALMKHEGQIRAITLDPDGSWLASAAEDGTASVWDLSTGKELLRVRHVGQYASWLTDVTFSPDGKLLATAGADNTARLWNLATGREVAHSTHGDAVWDVDFSADGQWLASVSPNGVKVLQAPDWQEVAILPHPEAWDIAFSPDGTLLVSAGSDDMARVWDTKTWQEVIHMKHNDHDGSVRAVAFSQDGRTLATGSGSTMTRVWDTKTWQEITRIPTGADKLLFSPDGEYLFTQGDSWGPVQVWDLALGGREVGQSKPQYRGDMTLSPDGRFLATATGQGKGELLVTRWQPEELTAEACSHLKQNLTWTEWQQYLGDEPYAETCPGLPLPTSVTSIDDMIHDITARLCLDDPKVALLHYESIVSMTLRLDNEFLSNSVCWYGAQEGFAATVLPACEQAVQLAPDDMSILDSRGIARALAGDTQGALADLKSVVSAWEKDQNYSEIVSQRKQVIKALKQGQDVTPYTEGCQDFAAVKSTPSAQVPPPTATPIPGASSTPPAEAVLQPTEVVRSFVAQVDPVVLGRPGDTVSYTLTVTNTGNVTGSYGIWAKPSQSYGFDLPELNYGSDSFDYTGSVGVIGPGDSVQMPIKVRIPVYATNDEFEQISLLLQSNYTPAHSMQMVTAVSYTTSIKQIGHVGLNARDVFVRDDYAYVAAGVKGLRILDVSNALRPVEVGAYQTADGALGQIKSVQVVDNYAYLVTNLSGIRIVEISDPTTPVEVGAYRPGGSVRALKLSGNYAYVVWNSCFQRCMDKLRIVDISDPTNPIEISVYGEAFTNGSYDSGDTLNDVAIMGSHAYLFMPDEMRVLDISNPAAPTEVDSYEQTGYRVVVRGDYAYIANDKQVRIVDISEPELVVEVGTYDVPDTIVNISQTGDYLYIATNKDEVYILDLATPSSPEQVSVYRALGNSKIGGVAAIGNEVYLAAGSAGLQIVDVADPASPKKAGVYGASASVMGVALAEGYAYTADRYNGLRILDLAPASSGPVEVGSYDKPDTGALDVAVSGVYAYVVLGHCDEWNISPNKACYGDLHILDVTDPAAPVETGLYQGKWHKVEVLGNYVFVLGGDVTEGDQAFHILDISNPAAPKHVASYDVADFALADGYLYLVSDTQERLTILDATTLKEVSVYDKPEQQPGMRITRQIGVSGHYAYIFKNYGYTTFSGTGWQVMDISDPSAPIEKNARINYSGQYQTWGEPAAATYGGYTFLAAKNSGLRVLDVTGPNTHTEVDSFGVSGNIMDVAVDDKGYIYAASDQNGLYILHYDEGGAN